MHQSNPCSVYTTYNFKYNLMFYNLWIIKQFQNQNKKKKSIHSVLPPILGSYLCFFIWEKINTYFIIFGIHKIRKNKAIFGFGMPPVTGGKPG